MTLGSRHRTEAFLERGKHCEEGRHYRWNAEQMMTFARAMNHRDRQYSSGFVKGHPSPAQRRSYLHERAPRPSLRQFSSTPKAQTQASPSHPIACSKLLGRLTFAKSLRSRTAGLKHIQAVAHRASNSSAICNAKHRFKHLPRGCVQH